MTAVLAGEARAPKSGGGLQFRFMDVNPLTGQAFCVSRFDDLPTMIALVVEDRLGLNSWTWNKLVRAGEVGEEIDCHQLRTIPWSVNRAPRKPRKGQAPEGKCESCWGTGGEIDHDGSVTGVVGATFLCACFRLAARRTR